MVFNVNEQLLRRRRKVPPVLHVHLHEWRHVELLLHPDRFGTVVIPRYGLLKDVAVTFSPWSVVDFGEDEIKASEEWKVLLPPQKLTMDHIHEFASHVDSHFGPATHVRLEIHPDGGVSRLRLFGQVFRG